MDWPQLRPRKNLTSCPGLVDHYSLTVIREAIRNLLPCRQVVRNYRKDGSVFWNELSITPVFNDNDQLTYFIGIQKDVSVEVEAKERVRELEGEVAQLKIQLAQLQTKA